MRKWMLSGVLMLSLIIPSCALWAQTDAQNPPAPAVSPEPSAVPARKPGKKRIAVIQFDTQGEYANTPVGRAVADMITTALVKCGRFDVVERLEMEKLLEEQRLAEHGVLDPATVARMGKILGVDYLLGGKVTEFGIKDKRSGGIGVLGGLVGLDVKNSVARVAMDMRLIAVESGKILIADTGTGEEKGNGVALAASDLNRYGVLARFDTKEWSESQLGKACRKAVNSVVQKVACYFPRDCAVLAVIDSDGRKYAILGMGSLESVVCGDEFGIYREEVTRDDSGEVVWTDRKQIGVVRVAEVQADRCKAEITTGAFIVSKGDMAQPIKPPLKIEDAPVNKR